MTTKSPAAMGMMANVTSARRQPSTNMSVTAPARITVSVTSRRATVPRKPDSALTSLKSRDSHWPVEILPITLTGARSSAAVASSRRCCSIRWPAEASAARERKSDATPIAAATPARAMRGASNAPLRVNTGPSTHSLISHVR